MTDMRHMEHLQAVADSDVKVLRQKEATYQGSWKAAGGRSAWFMARRNLDRLLNMMKDVPWPESFSIEDLRDAASKETLGEIDCALTPELAGWLCEKLTAEDIFEKIAEDPSGRDGTVLAVIRDARRYFTLVEAEMIARGLVRPEGWAQDAWAGMTPEQRAAVVANAVHETAPALRPDTSERRVPRFDDGPPVTARETTYRVGDLSRTERTEFASGTPEDRGQHARQDADQPQETRHVSPWTVEAPVLPVLYLSWARDMFYLKPWLSYAEEFQVNMAPDLSPEQKDHVAAIMSLYVKDETARGYILDTTAAPERWEFLWKKLPREKNHKEWEELADWRRHLYRWDEGAGKHLMRTEYLCWASD